MIENEIERKKEIEELLNVNQQELKETTENLEKRNSYRFVNSPNKIVFLEKKFFFLQEENYYYYFTFFLYGRNHTNIDNSWVYNIFYFIDICDIDVFVAFWN